MVVVPFCRVVFVAVFRVVVGKQAPTHTVAQALWLVEYFLQHEMRKASFVKHIDVHIDGFDTHFSFCTVKIEYL